MDQTTLDDQPYTYDGGRSGEDDGLPRQYHQPPPDMSSIILDSQTQPVFTQDFRIRDLSTIVSSSENQENDTSAESSVSRNSSIRMELKQLAQQLTKQRSGAENFVNNVTPAYTAKPKLHKSISRLPRPKFIVPTSSLPQIRNAAVSTAQQPSQLDVLRQLLAQKEQRECELEQELASAQQQVKQLKADLNQHKQVVALTAEVKYMRVPWLTIVGVVGVLLLLILVMWLESLPAVILMNKIDNVLRMLRQPLQLPQSLSQYRFQSAMHSWWQTLVEWWHTLENAGNMDDDFTRVFQ